MLNINAKTDEVIQSPDIDKWKQVREEKVTVFYIYHMDRPAETEQELVATYPNGGKEYREKVIRPEMGRFTVTTEDGEDFPYPIDVPDGISKDVPVPDIIDLVYWEKYTSEEIAQRDKEAEEEQAKAEEREAFMDSAPSRLSGVESGVDDSYTAIAELGELSAQNAVSIDVIMDAIAELGQRVEENNG